jgi:RNA polymerase sigma factor (TIGR02999 family)
MAGDETFLALLQSVKEGKRTDELVPYVYAELRRLAQSLMKRTPPGQTLQPTALVHEAYLRLIGPGEPDWRERSEFFAAAARSMRDILVEQARRKASLKRGGDLKRADQEIENIAIQPPAADLMALDDALNRLETEDPEIAKIVHLRYFAGLAEPEIAEMLNCSESTIQRRMRFARAWLRSELSSPPSTD